MPTWAGVTNLTGPTGSTGSTGSTGAAGADGKTVRSGSGAPSGGLGNDGDFYINTAANTIYGPKTSGAWGSPTSLIGPSTGTAGGALTGTYPNPTLKVVPWAPVALSDAATISVDASAGNHFRVTLGGARAMGVPSNPTDGQKILFELIQDGTGGRTVNWATAGVFAFGTDVTSPTLSTGAGKVDYVGFVYNSSAGKWRGLAVAKGY